MIARIWHGTAPLAKSDQYLAWMRSIAIPDDQSVPHNCDEFVLHRVENGVAHIITLSFWESRDAIVKFTETNIEQPKYYDFDRETLPELEPVVYTKTDFCAKGATRLGGFIGA